MIGYPFTFIGTAFLYPDPAFVDQLLEKGGMMDDVIVSSQFGIFVPQDVEAVGAGGDDLPYAIVVEQLDILVSHHLEQEFVAGPAGGVARA